MNLVKKLILADNQALTLAGLYHLLSLQEEVEVVAQVSSGSELYKLIPEVDPTLLIADYNVPGYLSKTDLVETARTFPKLNILVVSSDNDKQNILDILHAGVKGYITKDCSKEEVILAIQSTARGEKFYCNKVLDLIMERHLIPGDEPSESSSLTFREKEILALLARGNSTQKIADTLHLSPHTVHTHRKNIIRKLNIKSPTEFVIHAMDFGLIHLR